MRAVLIPNVPVGGTWFLRAPVVNFFPSEGGKSDSQKHSTNILTSSEHIPEAKGEL